MQLFTASYRAWRPEHGAPVVTSLTTPKWLPEAKSWPKLWPATPRWSYFRASNDEFNRQYLAQLERYGAEQIAARLAEIARSAFAEPIERLVLLCWETDPARCHRATFSTWWLAETGEPMTEVTEESR
jgi:hypothetical protein